MRNRVAKYLIPVFVFSVVFNVPKFFESEIEYLNVDQEQSTPSTPSTSLTTMITTPPYSDDDNNISFTTLIPDWLNVS
jgi:hypothetical protein